MRRGNRARRGSLLPATLLGLFVVGVGLLLGAIVVKGAGDQSGIPQIEDAQHTQQDIQSDWQLEQQQRFMEDALRQAQQMEQQRQLQQQLQQQQRIMEDALQQAQQMERQRQLQQQLQQQQRIQQSPPVQPFRLPVYNPPAVHNPLGLP